MMATASPRESVREMPERIVSSPRGVGYDLVMSLAISIGTLAVPPAVGRIPRGECRPVLRARVSANQIRVYRLDRLGHLADRVVLAHTGRTGGPERRRASRIAPQRAKGLGERIRIVWLDEHAPA